MSLLWARDSCFHCLKPHFFFSSASYVVFKCSDSLSSPLSMATCHHSAVSSLSLFLPPGHEQWCLWGPSLCELDAGRIWFCGGTWQGSFLFQHGWQWRMTEGALCNLLFCCWFLLDFFCPAVSEMSQCDLKAPVHVSESTSLVSGHLSLSLGENNQHATPWSFLL